MDTDTRHDEDHGFDDGAPPAFNEQAWASASPLPAMDAATRAANVASAREKDTRMVEGWADDFVSACICMHVWEHMHATPGALALWDAGLQLLGEPGSTQARIGFALALDALAQSPAALAHVAAELRSMLVNTAPGLEALKPNR